jgi:hypothetical protein
MYPALRIFFHISSSWVEIRLPTENQHSSLPESALKVCVVGGWLKVNLAIDFGYILPLAKPNKIKSLVLVLQKITWSVLLSKVTLYCLCGV